MEMLLMGACLALLGLAVSCVAFGAATRGVDTPETVPQPHKELPAHAPAHFFVDPIVIPPLPQPIPLQALLLQIESHVRLEQAAAESFLESPTPALLHSRTASPLVN
jgi:hypothetical protein